MDATCVTISGRPDLLSVFAAQIATKVDLVVHKTALDTLYHSPVHATGVRERVVADVASRTIGFPKFSDLKVPIWSTYTGHVVTKDETAGSLVELVVDMVLTQPVNWKLLVENLIASSTSDAPIQVVNVGPGAGLTRHLERLFLPRMSSVVDLALPDNSPISSINAKQESIAIVGMAVNMPGAPDSSKLWEILEQGINTISEVINALLYFASASSYLPIDSRTPIPDIRLH